MQKRFVFLFLLVSQIRIVGYGDNKLAYCDSLFKLAKGEVHNKNYEKAMELYMKIKIYAKENELSDMQIRAINNMGVIYRDLSNYEKAMEYYLEAYQLISKDANNQEQIGLLNNMGILYVHSNEYDKAAEYFDMAYKMTIEAKDSLMMRLALSNMANVSNIKNDLKQAEKYLHIAEDIMENQPLSSDSLWRIVIQYIKAEYLYKKKEYNLSEQLVLEVLNQETDRSDEKLRMEYLLLLSKIYYEKKNFPQAIFYAKDALKRSCKLETSIEIYEHLSTVYRSVGSSALAMQYQDSVIIMKDSLLKLNNTSQILKGKIQFDLNNLEKKLAENKEKQRRGQLISSFIIIFIVVLFILFFYVRSIKNKQLKITAALERKTYQNEIELKNRQLVSRTLLQAVKNELIEEIIAMFSHLPNQLENEELQSIIQKLQSQLKDPTEANWNSFLMYFEQTNPAFLSTLKIKHPDLTANDIRLSSYIYLNLDTKEIAKLLHITPDSYKKKKRFLARRMKVPTAELYVYLSGIV